MARMPGAVWKPLASNWNQQPRMRAYDFFCIHTMVGSLDGTDGYFRASAVNGIGYAGTESHFGVGPDGTIYQWQDTDYQADANGNGNWHVISSENADLGLPFPKWSGSDVPPLTPAQVEANARIAVWLYRTHGIPLSIAGNSKPGSRGLAAHRYGVPGYMPVGAEQWSSSQGKACPGDRRIAQLPAISARAQQLLAGAPTQEDTVSMEDVVQSWYGPRFKGDRNFAQVIHNIEDQAVSSNAQIAGLTAAVGTLAQAVASNRDDLTAADLESAVKKAILDAGEALRVVQAGTQPPAA